MIHFALIGIGILGWEGLNVITVKITELSIDTLSLSANVLLMIISLDESVVKLKDPTSKCFGLKLNSCWSSIPFNRTPSISPWEFFLIRPSLWIDFSIDCMPGYWRTISGNSAGFSPLKDWTLIWAVNLIAFFSNDSWKPSNTAKLNNNAIQPIAILKPSMLQMSKKSLRIRYSMILIYFLKK